MNDGRPILVAAATATKAATTVAALAALGVPETRLRPILPADAAEAKRRATGAAGLVLCGGPDLDPELYGEAPRSDAQLELDPGRDALDLGLLAGAKEAAVPVWGLCRGLQAINVFLGGSLWQDLPTQVPGPIDHAVASPPDALAHSVEVVEPETATGRILAASPARVNSRHHQAVRTLAAGLVVVARTGDGVVEAAELDDPAWWLRGVQWHPEDLLALPEQRALWREFLAAVAHRGVAVPALSADR